VVEEVMRMMLEIFNSCLSNSLHHNPNLVYAMLYQRSLFTGLIGHSTFHDVVSNIDMVSCSGIVQQHISTMNNNKG